MTAELDGRADRHRRRRHHRDRRQRVRTSEDVAAAVTGKSAGDRVKVELLRDGKKRTVEVQLDRAPGVRPVAAAAVGRGPTIEGVDGAPRFKICGLTGLDDARAGRRGRRLGARGHPLGGLAAPLRAGRGAAHRPHAAPPRRGLRRLRQRAARRGGRRGRRARPDDGAAPRRRGPGLLRRGRPAHRREGDQGGARALGGRRRRTLARFHTDFHLLDTFHAPSAGAARASPSTGRWPPAAARRAARPQRRAHPGERRRRRSPPSARSRSTWPAAPRPSPGVKDPAKRRARSPRPCGRRRRSRWRRAGVDPPGPVSLEHRYGPYGGQYVPETLMPALGELETAWLAARRDPAYGEELARLLRDYAGRPTPLYLAERLSEAAGREVWLKREDLMHTGSHKLNNALGQALLARRMGKRAHHRRDRRGPARRRERHRLRAAGPRVHRLHGRARTSAASSPTSSAWSCWARASSPSRPARARSRRPSPRRSATG